MNRPNTLRARFPQGVAFILWVISGTMTLSLFVGLAGDHPGRVFLACLWAAALEAAKILTWLRGWPSRALSVLLMGLTLVSALTVALHSVEHTQDQAAQSQLTKSTAYRDQRRLVDGLQAQIDDLVGRIAALPSDYVTAALKLTEELSSLRLQLAEAQKPLVASATSAIEDTTSFTLLARLFGVDRKSLEVVLIMLVAILTEASAVVLAGLPQRTLDEPPASPETTAPTAEDYLRAALDHPGSPRLLGRQVVAKRLGINETQARHLLAQLVREGRIRRSAKAFQSIPYTHPVVGREKI